MNTSNIINYKPKDFSELLGVPVKTLRLERDEEIGLRDTRCERQ